MTSRALLLLALALFAIFLSEIFYFKTLATIEHRVSDYFISQQAKNNTPDADIVIVDIDERSLSMLADSAGRWPWPRSVHAELLQGLLAQQPKAVVFDILFSDADIDHPEGDQYFADVIHDTKNVYFPMLLLNDGNVQAGIPLAQYAGALGVTKTPNANKDASVSLVLPIEPILATKQLGTHNILAEKLDGVVRSYPIFTDKQGWQIPSLPAKLAHGLGFAVPRQANMRINWMGQGAQYQHVSYVDILEDLQRKQKQRVANEFKDKILIIGSTATGLHDVRSTPVAAFHPGVEILANAVDNLKNNDSLRDVGKIWVTILGFMLLALFSFMLIRTKYLVRIGVGLIIGTACLLGLSYVLLNAKYLFELLTPLLFAWAYYLLAAIREYLNERKTRELAVATFSRFLDPRVVQSLVNKGATMASMSGQSSEISVLFSDIRGFTALSEKSPPETVVALLNDYFTLQAKEVFDSGGTLDKYIGDAIMAFWGAPTKMDDHALRAVDTAVAMSEKINDFRAQCVAKGMPLGNELDVGIGVHSGQAVVGFIGSENKLDYTAIGDTVNLTSRIEGLTKGVARVLVSEDTKNMCIAQALPNVCPYDFVEKGSFQVKGREQAVALYEPVKIG
jgi:adenylate cyclase